MPALDALGPIESLLIHKSYNHAVLWKYLPLTAFHVTTIYIEAPLIRGAVALVTGAILSYLITFKHIKLLVLARINAA